MSIRMKQIRMIISALLLLIIVSAYRIWSLNYYPQDPFRTYILYACYVFLFLLWGISIYYRVTQKFMRIWLYLEGGVMLIGLTLRFLQDTFWFRNIRLMRISGLCIAATILPFLLLGMYASLGIGQNDQYFMNHKWFGFLVPVLASICMMIFCAFHDRLCHDDPSGTDHLQPQQEHPWERDHENCHPVF